MRKKLFFIPMMMVGALAMASTQALADYEDNALDNENQADHSTILANGRVTPATYNDEASMYGPGSIIVHVTPAGGCTVTDVYEGTTFGCNSDDTLPAVTQDDAMKFVQDLYGNVEEGDASFSKTADHRGIAQTLDQLFVFDSTAVTTHDMDFSQVLDQDLADIKVSGGDTYGITQALWTTVDMSEHTDTDTASEDMAVDVAKDTTHGVDFMNEVLLANMIDTRGYSTSATDVVQSYMAQSYTTGTSLNLGAVLANGQGGHTTVLLPTNNTSTPVHDP